MKNFFVEANERILKKINDKQSDGIQLLDYLSNMDEEIESIINLYCVPQQTIVIQNLGFIHRVWGEALKLMQSYFSLGEELNKAFEITENGKPIDKKTYALYMIQAKTMLTYREILCLLENGYVDGAMAHFRSIYELFIVSHFIYSESEAVAERFIHAVKEQAYKYHGDSQYEWAKKSTDSELVSMGILIKKVYESGMWKCSLGNMSKTKFMEPYNIACKLVHPSPSGIIGRISTKGSFHGTAIKPSNFGLQNPAILSTIYTFEAQRMFWGHLSSPLFQLGFSTMEKVKELIIRELQKGEEKIGADNV